MGPEAETEARGMYESYVSSRGSRGNYQGAPFEPWSGLSERARHSFVRAASEAKFDR